MGNLETIQETPNLQEGFAYRQIGSVTTQVDSVDAEASIEFVMEAFAGNPALHALPIERNGSLIGILERSVVEKMSASAWTRFWQKDLDTYIQTPLLWFNADDYIEKNITKVLEYNTQTGVRFFAVFYRRCFFGIVGLHEMLARTTDLRTRDLAKARIVQQHLLEQVEGDADPRYSLLTYNRMANEVGGDFFKDFSFEGGDKHVIGCFDVSGKNVAASLSTMAIGSVFTALKYFQHGAQFGEDLTILIDKYIEDLTPTDMFITAALCYVDFGERTVLIQNCGHTPIYLFVPGEGGKIAGRTMNPNLPPLGMGILDPAQATGYTLPITSGLRIVMYTDGVTDMVTSDGLRYDDKRTQALFTSTYGKREAETREMYDKAIGEWIHEAMLPDDITIMDLRFK